MYTDINMSTFVYVHKDAYIYMNQEIYMYLDKHLELLDEISPSTQPPLCPNYMKHFTILNYI
jgi:hypothetical protein